MLDINQNVLENIRNVSTKKILFLPHAVRQMSRPERMISATEVRSVVTQGEIVEDYPNDSRGHSCLMFGLGDQRRAIHVVCAPKDDYLAIVTAYLPDVAEWEKGFKKRRTL